MCVFVYDVVNKSGVGFIEGLFVERDTNGVGFLLERIFLCLC